MPSVSCLLAFDLNSGLRLICLKYVDLCLVYIGLIFRMSWIGLNLSWVNKITKPCLLFHVGSSLIRILAAV